MSKFSKYFTLYEVTEAPPIKTDGYKQVESMYNDLIVNPLSDETTNSKESETPFGIINDVENYNTPSSVSDIARQFVGTKYSWGGTTPTTGFDCSGLIQYVYKQVGINLPRTAKEMESVGIEVPSLSDVKIGDIICTPGSTGKHVKLVSKIENGQIYTIEAKGKKDGIIESLLKDTSNITSIRRVLNQDSSIVDYFISKGLTRNQAKGIYGNLMQESNGSATARSKDGSYGIAQWLGDRKQRLFEMFGNNPTFQQQLDFIWWELNNTHKNALTSLREAESVEDSTRIFMNQFEKPNKNLANFDRRLRFAKQIS